MTVTPESARHASEEDAERSTDAAIPSQRGGDESDRGRADLTRQILEDRFWEASARVLAIVAVLLPVLGYTIRWLSLGIEGAAPQIGFSVDVRQAALVGVGPIAIGLLSIGMLIRFDLLGLRRPPRQRVRATVFGLRRLALFASVLILGVAAFLVAAIGLIYLVLEEPVVGLPLLPALLIAGYRLRAVIRGERPITLMGVAPATMLIVVAVAVGSALGPSAVVDISSYQFKPDAGLTSGRYATIGDADGFRYLRSCVAAPDSIIAIPDSAIAWVEVEPHRIAAPSTTLLDLLRGKSLLSADACPGRS